MRSTHDGGSHEGLNFETDDLQTCFFVAVRQASDPNEPLPLACRDTDARVARDAINDILGVQDVHRTTSCR